MKEVRDDICKIKDDVQQIFARLPRSPVDSQSPLHLNDFGRQVAEDLEAKPSVLSLTDDLLDRIGGIEDYELDEYCKKCVLGLEQPRAKKILASAYGFGLAIG